MIATALGTLFSIGTYLILRRDVINVVVGSLIISQTANIYLIAMGEFRGGVPVLGHGGEHHAVTDPVVQALVLTAIVIGFASTAFLLAMTYRLYEETETTDLEDMGGYRR
jgi:multicomponent Na+:H+ antiporter subunit C